MAHSVNKLITTLLVLLATATAMQAGPTLDDLDITVRLSDNGDARITEVRQMSIDSQGTECYIVMGNLNGSDIRDLAVSDETGRQFDNIGEWDVDRSRSYKEGKCGIVTKSNGYELCWGLGAEGERIYTISYTITNMVRAYDDADGFNFMFVATNINPMPDHARITFVRDDNEPIPQDKVLMWAFRYDGDIQWKDGTVVAETASSMNSDNAMIVMLRFEKDFLHPTMSEEGSFDQLRDRAFEGSDYDTGSGFFDGMETDEILFVILFLIALALSPFLIAAYIIWMWRNRRKAKSNLMWYRDLPYNGDLKKSYEVLNAYSWTSYDKENLVSAIVAKLVSIGALAIEEHLVEPTGLRKLTGGSAQMKKLIAIKPLELSEKSPNKQLLRKMHNIFSNAAGEDMLLQPNELRNWMKKHSGSVEGLLTLLKPSRSVSACNKDLENVRKVFGMELFLEDFTLANERHATELGLWKDYLVFAELFGIAKELRKDMMQANPEYLRMDEVCRQLNDSDVLPAFTMAALAGIGDVEKANSSSRSSGGGGWASFGGGGGFSGGGSGGGVR